MQDRYAGDIGDYVKMALLRKLEREGACKTIGVAWYRVPSQEGTEDGRYTGYLSDPGYWSAFCPDTFAALKRVVDEERSVARLQATGLLKRARFHGDIVNARCNRRGARTQARQDWFAGLLTAVDECDLVFVDPDNGIAASGFDVEDADSHKSITLEELKGLAGDDSRALVIYHHQTRYKGGHLAEIDALHKLLRDEALKPAGSLRAHPWSARLFLLVNATDDHIRAFRDFSTQWNGEVDWYPADETAGARTLPKQRKRRR